MAKLELKNISKTFDREVLRDINLSIEEGEFISLLGPSGCGKTTTLRNIAGITRPDKGDVFLDGRSILDLPMEKRGTVIVFQDYRLFPHMNVAKNIGFGLKMMGKTSQEIDRKVGEILALIRLEGFGSKYPNQLSGGQQQRVALGRALAVEPEVLLLDEPFSNLDMKLREEVRELTRQIQKELAITTILVTHDKEEAFLMSDRIALMLDGRIVQFDSPRKIYQEPKTKDIADFLGRKNYIKGRIEDFIFKGQGLEFPSSKEDGDYLLMIRPEDIVFSDRGRRARILDKKYAGSKSYYRLDLGQLELELVSDSRLDYQLGQEVGLDFIEERFIYFKE